jgi:hypothetical protein
MDATDALIGVHRCDCLAATPIASGFILTLPCKNSERAFTEGNHVLQAPRFPNRLAIALPGHWGWKRRPFYVFFTPLRLDTAKTQSSPTRTSGFRALSTLKVLARRSPLEQLVERRAERLAPIGQTVFDSGRHLVMDDPANNAVAL